MTPALFCVLFMAFTVFMWWWGYRVGHSEGAAAERERRRRFERHYLKGPT